MQRYWEWDNCCWLVPWWYNFTNYSYLYLADRRIGSFNLWYRLLWFGNVAPSSPSDLSISWSRLFGRENTRPYRSRIQHLSDFILWRSWLFFRSYSFSLLSALDPSVFLFSFIFIRVDFPGPWERPLLLTPLLPATSVVCGGRHLVFFVSCGAYAVLLWSWVILSADHIWDFFAHIHPLFFIFHVSNFTIFYTLS